VAIPATGLEAKFSGQYTVAHALRHGAPGLRAFTDAVVGETAVVDLARRVTLRESESTGAMAVGIDRGEVVIVATLDGRPQASAVVASYPGSPAMPITRDQLADKLADCVNGDHAAGSRIVQMARAFAGVGRLISTTASRHAIAPSG
jgi:2-methylcitrate dehydratase PrpD